MHQFLNIRGGKSSLTHLIKKIKQRKTYGEEAVNAEIILELHSSTDALDKLARVHGLYKDSLYGEVEGTVGVLLIGEPTTKINGLTTWSEFKS
jgi:hypothetical protein